MKTNSTFFKLKKNLLGVLFFMLATFLVMPVYSQTTVTIGTGTGNTNWVPVYTGTTSTYAYSYSQQIYTAAEITAGGGTSGQSITQIAFYVASGATISGNKTWVIYLGNTSTSTFSGTSAWITTANLTQVFTGTFNSGSSTGWVTVTLGTPFTWTGSNLVVAVDENSSTYGNTYYNYTSMGLNNYYVLRRYYSSDISPASPGSGTRDYYRSNIQLTFAGGGSSGGSSCTGTSLWSQNFAGPSTSGINSSSGWATNSGSNYACSAGDYIYYSSSSTNYFYTNSFHVGRGKGVCVSFDIKRYSGSGTLTVYARIGGAASFNTSSKYYSSWFPISGAITPTSSCANQKLDIPGELSGGQDVSICFVASAMYVSVDNIDITDGGTAATVPNIASSAYTKTFDESTASTYFYGPYTATSSFYRSTSSNNVFSYFTNYGNNNSSGAYARITSTGGNNGKVNSATSGYCAYISSTTADNSGIPAPNGNPCIITKELNTSTCSGATATLRFAFKQTYSGGYTFDEVYTTDCPRIFYATTSDGTSTGYSWTQATVNYYFPNGQWWYAATSLPKAQNVIVAFCTGTAAQQYNFDDIKVLNQDCSIATKTGEAISCTSNPGLTEYALNTPYTFTIANSTTGATYWKWIVRDLTTSGNPFYYGTTAGATPAIISGQGSQNATINFGTNTGKTYRVMCIPYNGNFGTDAAPTDACYAKISIYGSSLTQIDCSLNGPYTIGGSSPDYANFQAAVTDLINCGVSGPVTFNVRNGTYTEQISIPAIMGASATNTIIFQSETGNQADVTLQSAANNSSSNYVLQLNGGSYIKFQNMTINYSGSSTLYARVIWLAGGASYNTINNCLISGVGSTANAGCELIFCDNTGGTNGTDNTISNNTLNNGSYGIYYEGVSSSNTEQNVKIFGNTLNNQKASSLHLQFLYAVQVYKNKVYNASSSTSYKGLVLEQCNGDATHYNMIYNNWITSPFSSIANNSSTYLGIYYNNGLTTGSGTTSASATFYTSGGSGATLKINNNIFVNSGAYAAMYVSSTTTISDIDHNAYYAYNSSTGEVSQYIGYWGGHMARMADLKFNAWEDNSAFELNSAGINPLYTSATDLSINYAGFANKGTPISGITDDINGNPRDGSTPDIGAGEGSASTHPALSGIYTVGGTSPSYATIYDATEELNFFGVSAPVTFNIRNGVYTEQIAIGNIVGASSSNTVIYQSEAQDSTLVTLQYGSSLNNPFEHYTLHLVKSSYITVKNMTISATDSDNGRAVVIQGGSQYNKILNNRILSVASTGATEAKAVIYNSSDYLNNNNEYSYNNIQLGSYGIYISGLNSSNLESGNIMQGNILTDQSHFGVYCQHQDAPQIIQNYITTTKTYTYSGIECQYCDNALKIQKNEIYTTTAYGSGIELYYCDGTSGARGEISNNMIVIGNGASEQNLGLLINVTKYQNIFFNSVRVNSSYTSNLEYNCAFKSWNSANNQVIKNNIFVNKNAGYAIFVHYAASIEELDYNCLYTDGSYLGKWESTQSADASLASWQAVTAGTQDDNSVSLDPNFTSTSDLRLDADNAGLALGTPVSVLDDIDGQNRDASNPYFGADERISGVCTGVSATGHPSNPAAVCDGAGVATFTVNVSGTANYDYQWQINDGGWQNLSNGGVYGTTAVTTGSASNSNTLTITNPSYSLTGKEYRCVVTNCGGTNTATSNSATLTVKSNSTAATGIDITNNNTCQGTTKTLTPTGGSLGTGASWKWYSEAGCINLLHTGSTYDVDPAVTTSYWVRAEGDCGNTATATTSVTVKTNSTAASAIDITNNNTCLGTTKTLTPTGGNLGTGASWKWYSEAGCINLLHTGDTYDVDPAVTTSYWVRAEGDCGNTGIATNTVTVKVETEISSHPGNQSKTEGEDASFSVTASGSNISYQWQLSTNGGSSYTDITISGSNPVYSNWETSTLNLTGVVAGNNGYKYRCVVTGDCGEESSDPGTLTVGGGCVAVGISVHPLTQTKCENQSVTFTVTASGEEPYTYQWKKDDVNIDDATESSYTINPLSSFNEGSYTCYLTNCGGAKNITSNAAVLTVNTPVIINFPPSDATVTAEGSTMFNVATKGKGFSYQWQVSTDGGGIYNDITVEGTDPVYSGYNSANLTLTGVVTGNNGNKYRCLVSSKAPCALSTLTSGAATLTVKEAPTPGQWTGATSDDWHTNSNWDNNTIPDASTNVVISASAINQPVVTGAAICATLTINPRASVTVNGSITGGSITIKSDAIGTGGFNCSNCGNVNFTNATVERYVGVSGYHYITSPLSGVSLSQINDVYQLDNLNGMHFNPDTPPYTVDMPNIWQLDETHTHNTSYDQNAWQAMTSLTNVMQEMRGYAINFSSGNKTIIFTGSGSDLICGNKSYLVTKSATSTDLDHNNIKIDVYGKTDENGIDYGTGPGNGWHLVGNPYPSPLDWDAVKAGGGIGAGINHTIAFFKATSLFYGSYGYYNPVIGPSGAFYPSKFVASMQSFFIQNRNIGSPSLSFKNDYRNVNQEAMNGEFYKKSFKKQIDFPMLRLYVSENNSNNGDETVILIIPDADKTFDNNYDAIKLLNTDKNTPNLYIKNTNNDFAIKSATEITENTLFNICFKPNKDGKYIIKLSEAINIPSGLSVYLTDLQTGVIEALDLDKIYTFISKTTDDPDRFLLSFSKGTGISGINQDMFSAYYNKGLLYVSYDSDKAGKLEIYNSTGQKISDKQLERGAYKFAIDGAKGVYILRMLTNNKVYTNKFIVE